MFQENLRGFGELCLISNIELGTHFYWEPWGIRIHGQTILMSWVVICVLIVFAILGSRNLQRIPQGFQNAAEYVYEFLHSLVENQIGKDDSSSWVSFISTIFLFILVSNWSGALIPLKWICLPTGELASPTNDINTTIALAFLTSIAYFYGGIRKKGLWYFHKYVHPTPALLPINILEDITKPLSLSLRLFGNVLADELMVAVFMLLAPVIIPLPAMTLGLFTSSIQALIFATLAATYIGDALDGHL
uniref:ATP synthase subunit a, chloroplastic n=1 Tax=Cryptomonas sp. CCAC 1634B TaxID=2051848 RepID=A0A679CBM2_9CRYP|nr:ATP synthase CF0 subunit IV [Cryptomonas sp. CCAC 1634B]